MCYGEERMSAPDTVGSVCVKEELKGTDKICACKACEKEEK